MPYRRFDWHQRITEVWGEHRSARAAVDRLPSTARVIQASHTDRQSTVIVHSLADIEERKYWKDYMHAYEKCLGATSTKRSPWYVVPADDKLNTRLIVSRIVLDAFESLDLSYPATSAARRRELKSLRRKLAP